MEQQKKGTINYSPILTNEGSVQNIANIANEHELPNDHKTEDEYIQTIKIRPKLLSDNREFIFAFKINPKFYRLKSIISKGNPDPVFAFINVQNKKVNVDDESEIPPTEVAIKKIGGIFTSTVRALATLRELRILAMIWHPKITRMIDIYGPEKPNFTDIYFVQEKLDANLFTIIQSGIDYNSKSQFIPFVTYQILIALKYLHSCGILHNDIRPANILIDKYSHIKICNFVRATEIGEIYETKQVFQPEYLSYLSPEILGNKDSSSYTNKIDIWGVGCILLELLSKKSPYFSNESKDQKPRNRWKNQFIILTNGLGSPDYKDLQEFFSPERYKEISNIKQFPKKSFKELLPGVSDDALELLEGLLQFNPKKRYTIEDALESDYLRPFKNLNEIKESYETIDLSFKKNQKSSELNDSLYNHKQIDEIRNQIINEYNKFYDD